MNQLERLLDDDSRPAQTRKEEFLELAAQLKRDKNPLKAHIGKTMAAWHQGLFVDSRAQRLPTDNLDIERFFKLPKHHARHIHGHKHAGTRLVEEGPTLVPVLDAHCFHPQPFCSTELLPYRYAQLPDSQREAIIRRKIMRRARSRKLRPALLASLEERYRNAALDRPHSSA